MENHTQFIQQSTTLNEFKLLPLAGDASSRSYHRVISEEQSYILMSWEPFDPKTYPFTDVTQLFSRHNINVPKIISVNGSQGLMLLEDLGDLTLERKFWEFQDSNLCLPYYQEALDELIKIQFKTLEETDRSSIAFNTKFDHDKFMWEFNYSIKYLINGVLDFEIEAPLLSELKTDFSKISFELEKHSNHIAHRDYHSRNLMIKLGKIKVIDYQDARLGPLQYDLVSLLHDSYVDLSLQDQKTLLDYYKENASVYNKDVLKPDFDEIFKLQTLQRCFKACGSFASFYCTREDKRYLKYLGKTIRIVFNELIETNQSKALLKLLNESGALDCNYENL